MTRVLLLAALAAAPGCDNRERDLRDQLDGLVRQRQYLDVHQKNLRLLADVELAGRPQEALPPGAGARLTLLQVEYYKADARKRVVDAEIESVQNQLHAQTDQSP